MKAIAIQPIKRYIVTECDGDSEGLGRILSLDTDNIHGFLSPPEFYLSLFKGGYWDVLEPALTIDTGSLVLTREEWPEEYAKRVAEEAKQMLAAG